MEEGKVNRSSFFKFYNKYGIFIFLCIVLVFFSIFAPNFFSLNNMITILRQVSVLGTIVCALAIILISGGMDLSVGAQVAMGGVVTARLLTETTLPIPVVVVIALLVGAVLGFLNGFISLKLNIAPMIETLGMMLMLQGLALVITGGYPVFGIPDKFKVIGQGYVFNTIPVPVIIFILVVAVTQFILKKTYFGRYIYAIGGNRDAAHLAGININRLHIAITPSAACSPASPPCCCSGASDRANRRPAAHTPLTACPARFWAASAFAAARAA